AVRVRGLLGTLRLRKRAQALLDLAREPFARYTRPPLAPLGENLDKPVHLEQLIQLALGDRDPARLLEQVERRRELALVECGPRPRELTRLHRQLPAVSPTEAGTGADSGRTERRADSCALHRQQDVFERLL